jgi:hypothetical protein
VLRERFGCWTAPTQKRIGRAPCVAHEGYWQERATHEETRTLFLEHFDSYGEQIAAR